MKNFLRALRFIWPYRVRFACSILCALLAAVFWSLNFTAIYPVLKIISSEQNLHEWVEDEIRRTQKELEAWKTQNDELNKAAQDFESTTNNPTIVNRKLRSITLEMAKRESKIERAQHELYRYHFLQNVLQRYCPRDRFQTLALVLGLVLAGIAIKGFFEFWQESLVGSVVGKAQLDLRNRFFRNVLHLDVSKFHGSGTHELMTRFTNDMETLGSGVRTLLGKVIAEPLRAIGCILVACYISWQLTLMFVVLVPVGILILNKLGRMMKKATRRMLEHMGTIYKILQETFQGIRIVKAFTTEPFERRRFAAATYDYYRKGMWVVNLDALSGPLLELIGVAAVCGALLVGAYLVLNKQTHLLGMRMMHAPLDAEALLQLYVCLAATADPVRRLSNVYTRIQSGNAAADRIFHYYDFKPSVQINSEGPRLARHHESIEFRNLCFSYEPNQPILTGINFSIKHGEVIALVGRNGCGKTTLLNLLPRFYDPDHGSVLIDGTDIRQAHLRSLRQQISIVSQDTMLFDDTFAGNIRYGNRNATQEQVEEAARKVLMHDFITSLPLGYDTRLGEAAVKISGGQRQRIALARAMLRDPSILILDEFTSQADTISENDLHRMLREFMQGRTTFVITHRLHTLEIASRIVVLDNGHVEAIGSHQELMASCRIYQSLHDAHGQRLVA